ncbi:MAG: amidohydrolase [Firmicutes bacterium]|nr:amidohydrolase [Bacillota bacterium]
MIADQIYVNGKFYTSDEDCPAAEAVAVKAGKFLAVGSNEEIELLSGSGTQRFDLQGRFVLPGLVDAHTHIGLSAMMGDDDDVPMYDCKSKEEVLETLRREVRKHPLRPYYVMFFGQAEALEPGGLRKEEIDAVVRHRPVVLMEYECHSAWLNSGALRFLKIREDSPDIAPGCSVYERDEEGRLTGCIKEMCLLPILDLSGNLSRKALRRGMQKLVNYLLSCGVTTVYDAGSFLHEEKVYQVLKEMDEEGDLPLRFEATHIINLPTLLPGAIEEFKRLKSLYETDHIRFNTMKMMLDGTLRIHTARQVSPYNDTGTWGGTLIPEEDLCQFIRALNQEKIDFHVHTVGEGAVKMVMDCVERLRNEIGGPLDIFVTAAHIETLRDEDISRFKELGIVADFTPSWHGGCCHTDPEHMTRLLGAYRGTHTLRAKSVVDTGALVTFSSDEVSLHEMDRWNPFLGMEVGHTRQEVKDGGKDAPVYPPIMERLALQDLIRGYTITPARVLRLDDRMGSITPGKDADMVVLRQDLFEMDPYEIHNVVPEWVVLRGRWA